MPRTDVLMGQLSRMALNGAKAIENDPDVIGHTTIAELYRLVATLAGLQAGGETALEAYFYLRGPATSGEPPNPQRNEDGKPEP